MSLPAHLWLALIACAGLFLADCRIFYRNAVRGEASAGWQWALNLAMMFAELCGIVWLVVRGMGR